MAQAPRTTVTYNLDGSNRDFPIPFEYLARKFVQVTLVGVDRKVLTLNIDYRFTQRTIVTTTKNWGPADGYRLIEVRRYTSATERLVDFSDGSILRAYDLNTSQVQSLHIAEEGRDIATDTIGVDNNGDLDARGRKIVNLADGTSDFDAVNLRQQKQWAGSALNQADRAQREADRANSMATSAAGSNAAAAAQAQESLKWASESSRHAQNSANSATASQASNAESYRHSQNSAGSATEATKQAGLATSNGAAQVQLASNHADRAQAEANRSTTMANESSRHADRSNAEANRSKGEADRAKTEADKLGNMNALSVAIKSVVAPDFVLNDGWKFVADYLRADNISAYKQGTITFHNTLWSKGAFTTEGHLTTHGNFRSHGEATVGTTLNINGAGSNAHLWFRTPDGAENALIYAENTGALHLRSRSQGDTLTLNVDRSVDVGTNLRVGGEVYAGGRIQGGDILSRGNVYAQGGNAYLAGDGNIAGPAWEGGTLHSHIQIVADRKQPKHVFQSGRVDLGAPGSGGMNQTRINFHTPIADPVINVTLYRAAGTVTNYAYTITGIDNSGFTLSWQSANGSHVMCHWMACNPTNV